METHWYNLEVGGWIAFLSPAHEVGEGDIVITMSGRAAVRPCVRVSFPDDISETVSRIAFILHTHIH